MRKVLSNKIDVKYIENPYHHSLSTTTKNEKWPLLFINDKLCELKAINGIRPKYFFKKKFIVKFADHEDIHTIRGIMKLYDKITKNGDGKFFPKILAHDIKNKFIIQEYVPLTTRGITNTHRSLVDLLSQKYNLDDVTTRKGFVWNWGINQKTKNVVIYDFIA